MHEVMVVMVLAYEARHSLAIRGFFFYYLIP